MTSPPWSVDTVVVRAEEYLSNLITTEGIQEDTLASSLQLNQTFDFIFQEDFVYLVSKSNKYLTIVSSHLIWLSKPNENSKFHYILTPDTICLFKYRSNYTRLIRFNNNPYFSVEDIDPTSADPLPLDSILHIDTLMQREQEYISRLDSFVARYKTQDIKDSNSVEVTNQSKNTPYTSNFLFNIPINNNTYLYNLYINSLKNFYTSSYTNSFTSTLQESPSIHRTYTNIFTGSNQYYGYDNIYLNFVSNTLTLTFEKDKDTIFLAPPALPTTGIPISSTTLYTDGAIAGKMPFTSDRIAFKARDYRDVSIATSPNEIADNTWQYTWLSATDTGNAVWVDRYYYGVDLDVSSEGDLLFTPLSSTNIVDIPSTLRILPNREYKYFHQGKNNIKSYIDKLKHIHPEPTSTELLNINKWDTSVLYDNSIFGNDGEQVGSSNLTSAERLHFNGSNFAVFPTVNNLEEGKELYVGAWLEVEDWRKVQGNQILGNFSDGGFGLFNNQIVPTSLITLYDNINNYFYNINSELSVVNESYNIIKADPTDKVLIQRLSDLALLLINCTKNYITRYDINNNLVYYVDVSSYITDISQIELDSNETLYCYSRNNQKLIGLNKDGSIVANTGVPGRNYDRIECVYKYNGIYTDSLILANSTTQDSIVGIYGDISTVDIYNNIWTVKGANLYKDREYFASVGEILQISADTEGFVWLLHKHNLLIKIDSAKNIIIDSKEVFSRSTDITREDNTINLITANINNKQVNLILLTDSIEKSLTVIDTNYIFFNKIYLENLQTNFFIKNNYATAQVGFTARGDCTGYTFLRKFKLEDTLEWRAVLTTVEPSNNPLYQSIYSIPVNVANLSSGRHYFSLSFSSSKGFLKAYVDGAVVGAVSLDPFAYKMTTSTRALAVGTNTSKQGLLGDAINLATESKFQGFIYMLHVYRYGFNDYDVLSFYAANSDSDLFKDLKWNINIGRRNYIERIDKYFTFTMPGIKSKYYNIRIYGFETTAEHRATISNILFDILPKFAPADTYLNKLIWE